MVSELTGLDQRKLRELDSCGKLVRLKWSAYSDWTKGILYDSNEVHRFIRRGMKNYIGLVREEDYDGYNLVFKCLTEVYGESENYAQVCRLEGSGITATLKTVLSELENYDYIITSPYVPLFESKTTLELLNYICEINNVKLKVASNPVVYDTKVNLATKLPYVLKGYCVVIETIGKLITYKDAGIRPSVFNSNSKFYYNYILQNGERKVCSKHKDFYDILSASTL